MFSSYSFAFLLLHYYIVGSKLFSRNMLDMWFILLVPFLIMMAALGNWNTNDEEELEVGSGTYHGEDEEMEGDDDQEIDSEDGDKLKEFNTLVGNT
jgi:hypothetical protein